MELKLDLENFNLRIKKKRVVQNIYVGLWRSLVARPSGGRKVAGSSPASPTR